MNRHPDQTFREDVSHSEKEIPSSYLGATSPGFIAAVVGIIFAIQANNAKNSGDIDTARSKVKSATILGGVSVALMILGWVGMFAAGLVSSPR